MDNFSPYHCTTEYHLARLTGKGVTLATTIYTFAFHLSGKSGVFWCSIPNLAAYFHADEKTVRKAIHLLAKLGFFEELESPPGKPVRYKVVSHNDWRLKHGGRCVAKSPTPWDDEEKDPLAIALYAISGGEFKPFKGFVKGMRNTGHSDAAIAEHFRDFLDDNEIANWKHGAYKLFMAYLREHDVDNRPPEKSGLQNRFKLSTAPNSRQTASAPQRVGVSAPPKLLGTPAQQPAKQVTLSDLAAGRAPSQKSPVVVETYLSPSLEAMLDD